jgi:DNA modification methylase
LSPSAKNLTEILNKEVSVGNRTIDDLLDIINIWLVKRLPANQYEHPTSKPPELYEKSLRRCTKPGDKILELYGGSGSLLVACENMKRKCYMAELSPVFCDVIIKRYETLTGNKAKLISKREEL